MPPERRFLCSQCSCISSPNAAVSPRFERLAAAQAELLDVVQVRAASSPSCVSRALSSDPRGCCRRCARSPVKNSSRLSSRLNSASIGSLQRLGLDAAVRVEREAGEAAVRGDVLVLLADRLAEPVDLDLARQLGELARMQQPAPVRVERLEQRRREAARRAEAGAGRDVGQRRDLELRRPEAEQLDRLADDRMLHVVDARRRARASSTSG